VNDAPQGSEGWRLARLGKVTASRIADLAARTKTGYGASRANYMAELIVERLTGVPVDGYQNEAMRWGLEQEPAARLAYEFIYDQTIEQVGFVPHPLISDCGCSPDGLVGNLGLIEIKAPNTATHIDTLLTEQIPDKYLKQMQLQMACTGRHWSDFVSYDPRMPPSMQLWVQRIERDPRLISDLESEIRQFIRELEQRINRLSQRYARAAMVTRNVRLQPSNPG
jgi:predicted phage-related endonuclease